MKIQLTKQDGKISIITLVEGNNYHSIQADLPERSTQKEISDYIVSKTGKSLLTTEEALEQWRQSASLSRRRFMLGIKFYQYGTGTLEDAINTLRENLTEPQKTVIGISLDESNHFDRDDTDLKAMVSAIGMTPEQADAFYVWAENEEWRNE